MTKHNVPRGFQHRLYDAWISSGLSLTELGRRTGLSRSCLYAYILGGSTPNITSFAKICAELHVSSDYLLFGIGKAPICEPIGVPDARYKGGYRKELA